MGFFFCKSQEAFYDLGELTFQSELFLEYLISPVLGIFFHRVAISGIALINNFFFEGKKKKKTIGHSMRVILPSY